MLKLAYYCTFAMGGMSHAALAMDSNGIDPPPVPPIPDPPVPVPVPDPDIEIPTDPDTWAGKPDNISDELALSALACIEEEFSSDFTDPTTTAATNELIDLAVEYICLVNFLSKFYDIMGFLRIGFSILLIIYQLNQYFKNYKPTQFQKSITWMIQLLTVLQIIYSFYWNYRVFIDCE